MNRDETEKAIEVMQAWVDGKTIEYRSRSGNLAWLELGVEGHMGNPLWDWLSLEFRIKLTPREWVLFALTEGGMLQVGHYPPAGCHAIRVREIL